MDENREHKKNSPKLKRWLWRIFLSGVICALIGVLTIGGILLYFSYGLPSFDSIQDYAPPQVTRMFDRQNRVIAELFDEKRTVVSIDRVPLHVRNAFLAAEDADFYSHPGLDFPGMLRALWRNLKAGRVTEGGSTITQQVVKNLILGSERSYSRKAREILLAFRLESNLTKNEILSLYLNQIFFGHSCYGVQEASRFYFGKDVDQVSVAEAAVLASLPKSPSGYSPLKHPEKARQRRDLIIGLMVSNQMISAEEGGTAKSQPLAVVGRSVDYYSVAPYYAEHCRRILEKELGRELLYQGGLRIELAIDLDYQLAAQQAIAKGLREVDRRHGYRGPLARITKRELEQLHQKQDKYATDGAIWSISEVDGEQKFFGARWLDLSSEHRVEVPVVETVGSGKKSGAYVDLGSRKGEIRYSDLQWARSFSPLRRTNQPKSVADVLSVGDIVEVQIIDPDSTPVRVSLGQPPLVQGALVAIEPENRHVLAMVGGSDFRRTPLIRAVQSVRQPGSAFKPIVYATAIHHDGFTPMTILMDTPEVYRSSLKGRSWKPQNFEREFVGSVTLRHALAHSINTVAVKVASDTGIGNVINMAKDLGIRSELKRNLSLALGSMEVTPLELTNAYTTFAAKGMAAAPVFILGIEKNDGRHVPYPGQEQPKQAISPAEAFIMTSILRSVVENGTGKKALKLGRPVVGKTGTTNQQRDGWFVGYSPKLVAGVYVGFDDHSRMGSGWAQGAGTALPIWVQFMEKALEEQPTYDFQAPAGTVYVRVDPQNGLLAPPKMAGAVFEVFIEGTEPRSFSSRSATIGSGDRGDGDQVIDPSAVSRIPEGMIH
jgi:penicillin-binding protein 1A